MIIWLINMKYIMVFNSGSSSLKFSLFKGKEAMIEGIVDSIGQPQSFIKIGKKKRKVRIESHDDAFDEAFKEIFAVVPKEKISAIGHRVVHGGDIYTEPVLITKKVVRDFNTYTRLKNRRRNRSS